MWLAVSHNISITFGEWVRCSKLIARTSELCSCQWNLCNLWGYGRLEISKDSLKDCFENVNISIWIIRSLLYCIILPPVIALTSILCNLSGSNHVGDTNCYNFLPYWVILFCRLLIFFSKSTFSKNYFRNTIRVSNSLDTDQIRRFVGPNLGPNCLQRLTADDISRQRVNIYQHDKVLPLILYLLHEVSSAHNICKQFGPRSGPT